MGPNQTYKLLHSKVNHKQNKKTTYGLGENIWKWCDWQGLTSKIYKWLIQLSNNNKKQPNWKLSRELNRYFSKRDIQKANRHMKRCSSLLITKELQIKTIRRYYFTPVRRNIIKKSTNNKCWRGYGEKGIPLHCWWKCKLVQPYGKQ